MGTSGSQAAGKSTTRSIADDSTLPGPAPHTAGPHKYDWMNRLDPRVEAIPDTTTSPTTETKSETDAGTHHYAHDAALGAGVGGIGGAAYGSTKQGHTKKDSGVAGISPTTTNDQKYASQYTTDQKTSAKTSTASEDVQGTGSRVGSQAASTGDKATPRHQYSREAGAVGGGAAALGGTHALGEHEYRRGERSIPVTGKGAAGQQHYGRDAAIDSGGAGAVGLATHELYNREGISSTEDENVQRTSQQHATGVSRSDTYGPGMIPPKEYASRQQHGHESSPTGGIGSMGGTSKQQYRTLSSGTPSGVSSSQFSSNAPAPGSQYGTSASGPRSTMPGTFPEPSAGLDTYGDPISSSQAGGAAGVGGTQGYTTTKHGPTTVASDESGHTKLHKETAVEHLVSTVKGKLGA
jgi:hypothetical protein